MNGINKEAYERLADEAVQQLEKLGVVLIGKIECRSGLNPVFCYAGRSRPIEVPAYVMRPENAHGDFFSYNFTSQPLSAA